MLAIVLLIFAFVLFVLAAFNVPTPPRFNLVAAGLALITLVQLLPALHL